MLLVHCFVILVIVAYGARRDAGPFAINPSQPHHYVLFNKLAGRDTRDPFEKTCEMMRKVKTQQARSLTDIMTLHQQTLRLIDDILMYVADSCSASGLMNDIAEISGRIGQLRGTPGNGGR